MHNVNELWRDAAAHHADAVAVICDGVEYSYAAVDQAIRAFASHLRADTAVQPGDRIALIMPNCLHSIVCYLGALRAGAVALPVNIRLRSEEMRFILQDAGARAVVVHRSVWPNVWAAIEGLDTVGAVIGIDVHQQSVLDIEGFLADGDLPPHAACGDDVAAVIYTSGTTGLPKGAMITHGNILFNVQSTISGHGFRPDDRHMLIVPLFHVTGLNTIMPTAFTQGASIVVSADPSPAGVLRLIQQHHATTCFGVPTTMILLAQTPGVEAHDTQSLRLIAYSGAPMPVRAIRRLRELFPQVALHNFFGLTETTSVTTVLPDAQALERPESIGLPVPGLELAVVDEAGQRLPTGQVGELVVRGPSVVKGYFNRPDATRDAIRDGWLHTGDTAYIDEEGYVFLQGRLKEMIIVAGENVYPVEVENVLTRHPAVAEAAVIGVPHPVLGEAVTAVVVLRPGETAGEQEIRRYCAESLAGFKVPLRVEFRDELPRNPSGKVVKRLLRDS